MPRKLRMEYGGTIYHPPSRRLRRDSVMNRGDRREAIFEDDPDREIFMATLAETCRKTAWQVHAGCLMPTHFHLVVETPQPNLVVGMR